MVYISERGSHRVSVFTSEGVFVTSFGSHGGGDLDRLDILDLME